MYRVIEKATSFRECTWFNIISKNHCAEFKIHRNVFNTKFTFTIILTTFNMKFKFFAITFGFTNEHQVTKNYLWFIEIEI